jgi:phosphoribosylformylglycinamidine synthase
VCLILPDEPVAMAAACGGNSRLAALDPYLGGVWAVLEAARNVACVGARPLAITDCLNFGDPEDPAVFWDFSEAVRGIGDACRGLVIDPGDSGSLLPVISGNVSFYNQSETGQPILPTPIVACAGRVDDAAVCRDIGFKLAGSKLILLGELHADLGGSEYESCFGGPLESAVPQPDFERENAIQHTVIEGIRQGAILAAHDISHGGLLVTVSEMLMGSAPYQVGCRLELAGQLTGNASVVPQLVSENGGIVAEVAAAAWPELEQIIGEHGCPWVELGQTTGSDRLELILTGESLSIPAGRLLASFEAGCRDLFG